MSYRQVGIELQARVPSTATRRVAGRLLHVNSFFLIRRSVRCCVGRHGQWSFQADECHIWIAFHFIMFLTFVYLPPIHFLFIGIHPIACSLTGIKGTCVCVAAISTPAACGAGWMPTPRELRSCQQCGRHSTLPSLGSEASGAAGKSRSGAEFAISDYRPRLYLSRSRWSSWNIDEPKGCVFLSEEVSGGSGNMACAASRACFPPHCLPGAS